MRRISRSWRVPAILALLVAAALTIGLALVGWAPSEGTARAQKGGRGGKGSKKGDTSEKTVFVKAGATMKYVANSAEPGFGSEWTGAAFDDSKWQTGAYAIGRPDGGEPGLVRTKSPEEAVSIYTRAVFTIPDATVIRNLFLAGRYRDGYAVWLNGTEVYRSSSLPRGALTWNTVATPRDPNSGSGSGARGPVDISAPGIPALHAGLNLLAAAVWSSSDRSGDLLLAPNLSINRTAAVVRGPYLQLGTATSIVVRWRTEIPTESRVLYGSSPGDLTSEARDASTTTEHIVRVAGLQPATTYFYSVGTDKAPLAGGDADTSFVTAPAEGSASPVRVWILGDSGTAKTAARAVRDGYGKFAGTARADVWLMLGDNAYPDGTDSQYQAAVFRMYPKLLARSVLWPAAGNHDQHSKSADGAGIQGEIFTLPAQGEAGGVASGTAAYYAFDHANVHFISLDSGKEDRTPSGPMLAWLRKDLAETKQEWLIAYWHHAPYSKGSEDSDVDKKMIEMRTNALPILEEAGVDLVLGGHSHVYERSFLLDGHYGPSGTFGKSFIKDRGNGRVDGDGAYRKPSRSREPHEGAVYVTAGSSGHTGGGPLNHPAMFVSLKALGSVVLDIKGDELDQSFLDSTGRVRDHFTILKGSKK